MPSFCSLCCCARCLPLWPGRAVCSLPTMLVLPSVWLPEAQEVLTLLVSGMCVTQTPACIAHTVSSPSLWCLQTTEILIFKLILNFKVNLVDFLSRLCFLHLFVCKKPFLTLRPWWNLPYFLLLHIRFHFLLRATVGSGVSFCIGMLYGSKLSFS